MGEATIQRGQLYKEHVPAAASASIPTKYATYVINNSEEKKGFTSKSKRFQSAIKDCPGPGAYQIKENFTSPSYSKKGTGGFASRTLRTESRFPLKASPKATSYDLRRDMTDKHDFNRYTASFQKPIAQAKKYSVTRQPAPNQYNTSRAFNRTMAKPHGCGAAFKSKTKRSLDQHVKSAGSNLSPAQYQLAAASDDQLAVTSCFRSKTDRQLHDISKNKVPGPGTYDPKLVAEGEQGLRPHTINMPYRKHFLTISAPAMPMPPLPPTPGPGSYELVDYGQYNVKKIKSSAVFQSGSSRWLHASQGAAPGPGFYNPVHPTKQSYLFNTNNKWQPA